MMQKLTVYGAQWCSDCRRSKRLLDTHNVQYTYIDLEAVPEAAEIVEKINNGMQSIPTILFPDGKIMVEPSDEALLHELQKQSLVQ